MRQIDVYLKVLIPVTLAHYFEETWDLLSPFVFPSFALTTAWFLFKIIFNQSLMKFFDLQIRGESIDKKWLKVTVDN